MLTQSILFLQQEMEPRTRREYWATRNTFGYTDWGANFACFL